MAALFAVAVISSATRAMAAFPLLLPNTCLPGHNNFLTFGICANGMRAKNMRNKLVEGTEVIAPLLSSAPISVNELIRQTGTSSAAVNVALLELELAGNLVCEADGAARRLTAPTRAAARVGGLAVPDHLDLGMQTTFSNSMSEIARYLAT